MRAGALGVRAFRESMRPPIIINEHGDISLFPSVEAAARYVEPVDVRNNEYIAFDSAGFLLQLVPTEPVISIPGYQSDVPHQKQLAQILRSYLERASSTSVPPEVTSLEV